MSTHLVLTENVCYLCEFRFLNGKRNKCESKVNTSKVYFERTKMIYVLCKALAAKIRCKEYVLTYWQRPDARPPLLHRGVYLTCYLKATIICQTVAGTDKKRSIGSLVEIYDSTMLSCTFLAKGTGKLNQSIRLPLTVHRKLVS